MAGSRGSGPMIVDGNVQRILRALREKTERLTMSPTVKRVTEEERADADSGRLGKVVLYVTSMKAVRATYERCQQVLHIIQAHNIQFKTKDVFLHPDYGRELNERMQSSQNVPLPQLFVAGEHVGGGEVIIEMNETGKLKEVMEKFKDSTCSGAIRECQFCAGRGFVPCLWCKGSKKGIQNAFNNLKCTACNQNGLQKCPQC